MKIQRRFTTAREDVFEQVEWTRRSSRIVNPDGSVVFEMNDAEVPKRWSQLATDIMVSKYFRKAGVPQTDQQGNVLTDDSGKPITGPERSVRQVIGRLAGCWRHWGEEHGYFDTTEDAEAFYDELCYMMLNQMAAPNSPQWFNTGLNWAYGLTGPAQGHWITDPQTGQTIEADDAYTHPQPHACFIQSVDDDLVNPGGIMDLWTREARLFKYGSGTGTNFSGIRGEGEALSGGGKSSGLMSFLKIGDRAAGAIKSGGTTRRAAKMVCLDLDHPDIESFVNWKVREEIKVSALVEGMKQLSPEQKETARRLGLNLDYDFNGEAYQTVSGQNANNSVRIPNSFFKVLDEDGSWDLTSRTDGQVLKSIQARDLWEQIGYAAWRCADPGVQYDGTINEWHTCPASGRINASNPCSEYMFLDNTACNLASINLLKFYDSTQRQFDVEGYEHAIRIWTMVLEISVLMAAFPSREIARLSYEYRTLGLGYANLGALLMQAGISYDSDTGRAIGGAMGSIMTGRAYATSAEMAGEHGPFSGYFRNREHMLRVVRNHRRAAYGVPRDRDEAVDTELGAYEGLTIAPVPLDGHLLETHHEHDSIGGLGNGGALADRAKRVWDEALKLGTAHGFRNAQATVIAPTGTIGLLMDCDTTGVEPDFALVKFKKLAGGGYFKIANQSLRPALAALGYEKQQIIEMVRHVMGAGSVNVPMPDDNGRVPDNPHETFEQYLRARGATVDDVGRINDMLGSALELGFVFNALSLGEQATQRLGAEPDEADVLRAIGLSRQQIDKLNEMICGTGTIEGAPHLKDEHLPVFDCANKCGRTGRRFIAPQGHIRMMAAVQPFISGAISKTINMPFEATVEQIAGAYRLSWELGLKANALYRDGSKLSQPLNVTSDADEQVDDEQAVDAAKKEVSAEAVDLANRIASAETDSQADGARVPVEKIVERIVERPLRRRLPNTRRSITHKFNVAGHEGYLTVGLYDDGSPGELFITMAKEGSTIGGLMDSLGTAISVALQYGVPIESLVHKFTHQRFEPAGMTDNRDIPFAKSLVDYIFRWMGIEFIAGYREANAPKRPGKTTETPRKARQATEPQAPTRSSGDTKAGAKARAPRRTDSEAPAATGAEQGRSAPAAFDRKSPAQDNDRGGNGDSPGEQVARTNRLAIDDPELISRAAEKENPLNDLETRSKGALGVADRQNATAAALVTSLNEANSQMMGDAPACDVCGSITVRNGTCYKCLNCGNSMGCS
jgi:ribonucleoside-diphosphate reductase alpha chain